MFQCFIFYGGASGHFTKCSLESPRASWRNQNWCEMSMSCLFPITGSSLPWGSAIAAGNQINSFHSASILFITQGQLLKDVGALQWGAQSSGHLKENHTLRRTYIFVAGRKQHQSVGVWDFPALKVQGKSRHITQMKAKNSHWTGVQNPLIFIYPCSLLSAFLFQPALEAEMQPSSMAPSLW